MKMEISKFFVSLGTSVLETMRIINENTKGIVFAADNGRLIGTVTDGDIRRYIIGGGEVSAVVENVINRNTIWLETNDEKSAGNTMREKSISAIPVVDGEKRIIKIFFSDGSSVQVEDFNRPLHIPLVIMAGGKGTRLKPYTDILPKPLIPIGEKTITERIIDKFGEYSDSPVYMIVNYKKEFIKAYFREEDERKKINFVDETEFLGTGGGLKLLENRIKTTFFMSNCDILINADYSQILKYHSEAKNIFTLVCARKCFSVPYGTVEVDHCNRATGFVEKPSHTYFVNTGFYVIEPDVFAEIPENTYIHITDIISEFMKREKRVGVYLIEDSDWMDMGQFDEMEKMRQKLGV